MVAAALIVLTSCSTTPAPRGEVARLQPYRVGPLQVLIRPEPEVEFLCRLKAMAARTNARIRGCYLPEDRLIISSPDPDVLLHEFKHYFEGDWHN